jgi:hypothetical protein
MTITKCSRWLDNGVEIRRPSWEARATAESTRCRSFISSAGRTSQCPTSAPTLPHFSREIAEKIAELNGYPFRPGSWPFKRWMPSAAGFSKRFRPSSSPISFTGNMHASSCARFCRHSTSTELHQFRHLIIDEFTPAKIAHGGGVESRIAAHDKRALSRY